MEILLVMLLILFGVVMLFFTAVGIAFFWVVGEAQKIMDKQKRD